MVAKPKKISHNDIIGQRGINLIERIVLDMGFLWHPTNLEAGIDGIIEVRDPASGIVTNSIIQVQSKATENCFQGETDVAFDFKCSERDLEYWLNGNAPVILVRSRPDTNEAYWVDLKSYFADADRRSACMIHFHKTRDQFWVNARDALARLSVPRGSGVYLSALPKAERLVSNLLKVRELPSTIYRASTDLSGGAAVWEQLRQNTDEPPQEWVLHGGAIISFHDLRRDEWKRICKRSSAQPGDTSAWSASDVRSSRQVFIRLLNRCLTAKLHAFDIDWSKTKECYFFLSGASLSERYIGQRRVFGSYMLKNDPSKIGYFRHCAFRGQFRRIDRDWYLEITPTYHFTRDGVRLDAFYEERLSGIKRLEENAAVAGQLAMWAKVLKMGQQKDLFSSPYAFLKFGSLEDFEVEFGIFDKMWAASQGDASEESGFPLFDQ